MSNSVPLSVYDGPKHSGPGGGNHNHLNVGLLASGLLVTFFGILCVLNPENVTTTMALFMGVALVIAGVIMLSVHFKASSSIFSGSGIMFPGAVLTLAIGLFICLQPALSFSLFTTVLGIAIALTGLFQIGSFLANRQNSNTQWRFFFGTGILDLGMGLVLIFLPEFIGIFLGTFALGHGLLMIFLSLPIYR